MLVCVTFANVGCALREGKFREKKTTYSLMPSSICVADCVRDEVVLRYCFIIITCAAQVGTVELEHAGAVCSFAWMLMPNYS
jgi:hypothetical protein